MKSNKSFLRIVSIILTAGILSLFCIGFFTPAYAVEYTDNARIKVGLNFGSSAVEQASLTSSTGFIVINANEDTGEYTEIAGIAETEITVKNVGGKAMIYSTAGALLYSGSETLYIIGNNSSVCYNSKTYLEIIKFFCKDGLMRVINIISLENYIKGVLPREIYPSWPEEALKASAIVARSYAMASLKGKHKSYDADVCTTTCCQVFGGNGDNEHARTNAAVDATKNIVLAYKDEVALTVYTSSSGDNTESAAGAWGGSDSKYPYLRGVSTPFETPEEYPNGAWSYTFTPAELKEYLETKSAYKGRLTGNIVAIDCEYAYNGYVRKLTIRDNYGNTITASTSGDVRSLLYKYAKSAKFVIYPDGQVPPVEVPQANSGFAVFTASGMETRYDIPADACVLRADYSQPVALYSSVLSNIYQSPVYTSVPKSYTISGTGYGHGVGLSQFGSMTLAKNGKTHSEILAIYYPGTYLTSLGALGNAK